MKSHEIRNGNLVVSLTNDAYEYNNEFFTIEVTQMDGSECIENDADMSGLPVLSNKAEIDLFLSAAMEYAVANCVDVLEPVVRRLSHSAAQAGLNAIAKVETKTFADLTRG